MRYFLFRAFAFLVLACIALNAVGYLLIQFNWQGHAVENSRIYFCLAKARQDLSHSDVFVLGDSVAHQMYPPETQSDELNSLAMVMPSTLAGHYFLLARLAKSTKLKDKTIVLVLSPTGFATGPSERASFHYVMKPFYNSEFAPWEDLEFRDRIGSPALCAISQVPMIKCSNWNPPEWMTYLKPVATKEPNPGLVDWSAHFLGRISQLCELNRAKLRVLPTVQPKSRRDNDYSDLRRSIEAANLSDLFTEYFDSFHYREDHLFKDGAHVADRSVLGDDILQLKTK